MDRLLAELNESQRLAVLYNEGPSLIIAGAGSGKTRVLTYKIAYLIANGMAPWSIMALTFTNKAAREMKERIAKVVGEDVARKIWMGTFHSIFAKILRANAQAIGFRPDFTIYDSADSKSLIKSIIKEMGLDDKKYKASSVQGQISNAKNHLVTPQMYRSNSELMSYDIYSGRPHICDIYVRYWERCKQAGAMDFDDLLLYTNILFRDNPDILARYQDVLQFILVDEYQDTNKAQHLIIEMLSKKHQKVCVVGDDAQSIYSFRGANIANILNFDQSIPGTKIFKLEQNYRSTQNIVNAANSLIKRNTEQIQKNVFSENMVGEKLPLINTFSDFEEGYVVARHIEELHKHKGANFSDFAILYRTNAQSRVLEEAFRKNSIPYRIYGGLSFYQRKEIKDVIAYARLAINPDDEEAFKRVVNYPTRGIGATTLKKIALEAIAHGVSYYQVINDPLAFGLKFNAGTSNKLNGFRDMIDKFGKQAQTLNAYEMVRQIIIESGIMKELKSDDSIENITRQENVDELLNGMQEFVINRQEEGNEEILLTHLLSEVSLMSDQDTDKEADADKVTMMTVHASKGLEFRYVFVVGMEEDLFPSMMAKETPRGLEEERRLFYVALTRAEEKCFLSYASSRYKHGKTEMCSPSRFLKEIDANFIDLSSQQSLKNFSNSAAQDFARRNKPEQSSRPSVSPAPSMRRLQPLGSSSQTTTSTPSPSPMPSAGTSAGSGQLRVGATIKHERFGIGEVSNLEGVGDNQKATVNFKNVGQKQLLLKFARFEIID